MMKNCMFHIQHFWDNLLFELYGLIDTFLNHNKAIMIFFWAVSFHILKCVD